MSAQDTPETGWSLARLVIRSDVCVWSPPWPMFVMGLRFSKPVEIESVHVGLECVATNNVDVCRAHPELRLCELTGKYQEWSPKPWRAGFELRVGVHFAVKLGGSVYWAELLHQPLEGDVDAEPPPLPLPPTVAPREGGDRRKKFIQQCLDGLRVSSRPRYPELEPMVSPIPKRRER